MTVEAAASAIYGAIYDNHTAELVDAVLPDIREALRLGPAHPDGDRLMLNARAAVYGGFEGTGESVAVPEWVFRTLVGVAEWEARDREGTTHPPSRTDRPRG